MIATSGSTVKAAVRAPAYEVSSRTDATATTSAAQVAGGGRAARGLEHDERAEAVVERARGEAPRRAARPRRAAITTGSPICTTRRGVVAVARADVDPEVVHVRHALALLLAEEVARGLADDAGHRPGGGR